MRGYDLVNGTEFETAVPAVGDDSRLVVICNSNELYCLLDVFGWDKDTVDECTNLDEKVRFTNYDGYDFVSMLYAESTGEDMTQREVNIFFSDKYLTLVLPESPGESLSKLSEKLMAACPSAMMRPAPLIHLYYLLFDNLASYYMDSLEEIENNIEDLAESIEMNTTNNQIAEIISMRKTTYTYKKLLRALSYVGDQVLLDDNKFLGDSQLKHFRDVDTRLAKLYDFADSLFSMSNDLLNLYDSKSSAQMNETVKKLTILTLFFGPPTVIAGIYGMNFISMPELEWTHGYPIVLGLMVVVSTVIYLVLRAKKWL
jgi:magnesium transporter